MPKNAFEKELLPSGFLLASVPPTKRTQHRVWLAWLLSVFAVLYLAYSNVYQLRSIRSPSAGPSLPDLYEASITELQAGLQDGAFTSVHLVQAYLKRIDEVNLKGPALRAVLEINPSALAQAQLLDEERAVFGCRGPMHGIPILIKDNIATISSEGMNTTAGSYSLLGSIVPRDAGVVTRLRKAGAIILGKTNMCEFAHARGSDLASGWSGRGGQTSGAYYPRGNPCGSSGGSGVAASIGLAAATLGTETDGSITCPSSYNNGVGIKPTVGLTSRAGAIPITSKQDTIGPIVRSVADAAIVLSVIAGHDALDNDTTVIPHSIPDYSKALNLSALYGKRIGVPRKILLDPKFTNITQFELDTFKVALKTLESLGATIIEDANLPSIEDIYQTRVNRSTFENVLIVDYRHQLNAYYAGLLSNPSGVRNASELVKFNDAHKDLEKPVGYESQDLLEKVAKSEKKYDEHYYRALAYVRQLGRERGIDAALKEHNLDALVAPAYTTTTPAAIAGYPIVTVPLGFYPNDTETKSAGPSTVWPAPGVPFGLSFMGTAWSEYELIGFAYAYEQKTKTRLQRRAYPAAIPLTQLRDIIGKR